MKLKLDKLRKLHAHREISIQSVEDSFKEQLSTIREQRKQINEALDKLEKGTLNELTAVKERLTTAMRNDVVNCTRIFEELKSLTDTLQYITNKSTYLLFIANTKCLEKIKHSEKFLQETSVKVKIPDKITFQADPYIKQFLTQLSSLGKIIEVDSEAKSTWSLPGWRMFSQCGSSSVSLTLSTSVLLM
ncbi:hypothetical protein DPMN_174014 [Dreissena polymorpha]|uniref:Uncharacterized protein n=1 Tax=Dreissena polymorpha TaxID=45954 RepID=A0A9D4IHH0_DREPO|nr:hypothetical protein DPMN_174014 [Dreissena polymorpha]